MSELGSKRIFTGTIFMQNENIINFTVTAKVKFKVKYLEHALEYYELRYSNQLQEKFKDSSFLDEFTQLYHIDIVEYEHVEAENYNELEY